MQPMIITPDWNLANARACLEACAWVYENPCELSPLLHAAIFDCGNARLLAFRGSASVTDWLTDFQFARTVIRPGVEVHHGINDSVRSADAAILRLVNWKAGDTWPLFVTGHSLGGGQAEEAALEVLVAMGVPIQRVITFGQPRVGNKLWAQQYDLALGDRTDRVVNQCDLVPRIPLLPFLTLSGLWAACKQPRQTLATMAYRHTRREVFLPAFLGGYRIDPPLPTLLLSDIEGTWAEWRQGREAQLADHHYSAYRERMAAI
jgi:hypothetical protein